MRHLLLAAAAAWTLGACGQPTREAPIASPAVVDVSPDAANIVAAVADARRP